MLEQPFSRQILHIWTDGSGRPLVHTKEVDRSVSIARTDLRVNDP